MSVPYYKESSRPRDIEGVEHWFCPSCTTWVPRDKMGTRRSRWNGLDIYCKACKRGKERARRNRPRTKFVPKRPRKNTRQLQQPNAKVYVLHKETVQYKSCGKGMCRNHCLIHTVKPAVAVSVCRDCSEPITQEEESRFDHQCVCCYGIDQLYRRL